jgi:hypothetical protein
MVFKKVASSFLVFDEIQEHQMIELGAPSVW